MSKRLFLMPALALCLVGNPGSLRSAGSPAPPAATAASSFAGAWSCRESHEKFYQLWAPSHHGLAMQPVTTESLKTKLEPHKTAITIKDHRYLAVFRSGKSFTVTQNNKPCPSGHAKAMRLPGYAMIKSLPRLHFVPAG